MTIRGFITKCLALLQVRAVVGGLEISDAVLRYAMYNGAEWQIVGLRLPPGIIEGGRVKQHTQFIEALKILKSRVTSSGKKLNVVMSLSSTNIYTQVFSLPMIEGDQLEKAIQLNIQMVSPEDISQTYFGSQIVGEDEKSLRLEILSAFIGRAIVDEFKAALNAGGFMVSSVESRALSLIRLMRLMGQGFDLEQSYVLLSLDTNGMEFLVIRKGQLYFQYFNPWQDLEGAEHQISAIAFEAAIVRNLHQVLNFYHSHWSEPVSEILLSATTFQDEVAKIITENFSLRIRPFILNADPPVSPEWFAAVGSGLRGQISPREDSDISLLGVSAQEEFRRHQSLNFFGFWRVLVPLSLLVLLVVFAGGQVFLNRTKATLEAQVIQNTSQDDHNAEVSVLRAKVKTLNTLVDNITVALDNQPKQEPSLRIVVEVFESQGVTVRKATFRGPSNPVQITARAQSESQVLALKKSLDADSRFDSVNLPLTEVRKDDQGVTFSINFLIVSSKAE